MTIPAYDESVQEAVARETARRKRVLLAFLALLLVPIVIGAYALTKAPAETEKVANDVAPLVTERVAKDVVTQAEPLIRDNVSREIAKVEPRIASVGKDITDLRATVQETSAAVAAVKPQLTSVGRMTRDLDSVRALANTNANANREALDSLARKLDRIDAELKNLQRRVVTLERRNVPR